MPEETEDDWGEDFFGQPFEGLGNVNDALCENGAEKILLKVPEFLQRAILLKESLNADYTGNTILLACPGAGDARVGFLCSSKFTSTNLELESVYPLLSGEANRLTIFDFKAWKNGVEGMVAAASPDFGNLNFFDPFYFYDEQIMRAGKEARFNMAALAFDLNIGTVEEFEVTKGGFYDKELEDFLQENPEKTAADFPNPVINTGSLQMLLPTRYTGEFQFRTLALAREKVPFLDEFLWRYLISFSHDEDERGVQLWLYVAPHVISGRVPLVGDYIEGVLWLTGHLVGES